MKNKKKMVLIIVLLIIILLSIYVVFIHNTKYKKLDFDKIETEYVFGKKYDLAVMDNIDILSDFGFSFNEIDNGLFLKTKILDKDDNEVTELLDTNYIILIQDDQYNEFYDALYSYIDSNKMNLDENTKEYRLYNDAILGKIKSKKITYMFFGKNNKQIKKNVFKKLKIK